MKQNLLLAVSLFRWFRHFAIGGWFLDGFGEWDRHAPDDHPLRRPPKHFCGRTRRRLRTARRVQAKAPRVF